VTDPCRLVGCRQIVLDMALIYPSITGLCCRPVDRSHSNTVCILPCQRKKPSIIHVGLHLASLTTRDACNNCGCWVHRN